MTSPEPSTSSGDAEPPLNSWKIARCGLARTLARMLSRPRCAMPSTISRTPSCPPRLMICSSAGHGRFAAVEAEALGAGVLDVDELLEALGLDQLVEDRLLAFRRERDALVRPLDAFLDPALLGGVGDVQELDAERLAIGPLQDLQHLGDGREIEPEHVVDEDLAAVVGLGEAVGRRDRARPRSAPGPGPADRAWRAGARARGRRGSS